MGKKLRSCCVCNEKYSFCPRCPEDSGKEAWHFAYCSSDCREIYKVTAEFENGELSAEDAKARLKKLNLSKAESFGPSYKNSIQKIMYSKIEAESVPAIEDTQAEEIVTE